MLQPAVRSAGCGWLGPLPKGPKARAPQRWDGAIPGEMGLKLDVPYGGFSAQASEVQNLREHQRVAVQVLHDLQLSVLVTLVLCKAPLSSFSTVLRDSMS